MKTIEEGIRKGIFKALNPKIMGNFIAYNMFFFPLRGWYFRNAVSFEEVEKEIIDFTLEALLVHPEPCETGRPKGGKRAEGTGRGRKESTGRKREG